MYILVKKKGNEIKMYSENKIDYDKDIFELVSVPDEDINGYQSKYIDGKIVKEKITAVNEEIKEEVKNATTIKDLKEAITKLL